MLDGDGELVALTFDVAGPAGAKGVLELRTFSIDAEGSMLLAAEDETTFSAPLSFEGGLPTVEGGEQQVFLSYVLNR